MNEKYDAVVALAGFTDPGGHRLSPDTLARVDLAVDLLYANHSEYLILTGGFSLSVPSERWYVPQAMLMKNRAILQGVPEGMISVETEALDTIGNAVLTKQRITEPHGWKKLAVVTSHSHVERSIKIFQHVMGQAYELTGFGSHESHYGRIQRIHEAAGSLLLWSITSNTEEGDDKTIKELLFDLIPKYQDVSLPTLNRRKLAALLVRGVMPLQALQSQVASS